MGGGAGGVSSIEEYFRVNVEKKLFIKVPEQEDHDLTPATRLLEKRREMLEVENGLTQQKEEFSMKMESLLQRREELARKESQLKESLLKFDKFLKENDAKRNRAIKKAIEEQKTRGLKELEIQQLKDQQADLVAKKERGAKAVDTNLMYQKYLESILEAADEFGEVKDLLARHDTLAATNQELLARAKEAQERTEADRLRFAKITEEKNNIILNYNNEIAKLQTKLEESQLRSGKFQLEWDLTLKNATAKTLLLGQIKMATSNLFSLVKGHLSSRVSNSADTCQQLDKIQQFIIDLSDITSSYTAQDRIAYLAGAQSAAGALNTVGTVAAAGAQVQSKAALTAN
ncbi:coiled-coil domain-containing protein 42 [Zopfochytrium polystomum]|nr:coiled-coil domain-containing protein 42 [Zopfochytrium polystomum]